MSERRNEAPQSFSWLLQIGDDGLPAHLPMGVTADGRGPTGDNEAHHYLCWCGDRKCLLTRALRDAWLSGMRHAPATPPAQPDGEASA